MTKGFAGGKVDPKIAGAKGGRKSKGRTLSPEHKQKIKEAYWRKQNGGN
jgi:hypothetical protein